MTTGMLLDAPMYSLNSASSQGTHLVSDFATSLSSYGSTSSHSSPAAKLFAPSQSFPSAMEAELQAFHRPHCLEHQLAYYQHMNMPHADMQAAQQCMSAHSLAMGSTLLPVPQQLAPAASTDSLCRSLSTSSDASSHLLFQSPLFPYPSAPQMATMCQDGYQPMTSAPHPLTPTHTIAPSHPMTPQLQTMISPRQPSFLGLLDTPPPVLATAFSHPSPAPQAPPSAFSHPPPSSQAAAFTHAALESQTGSFQTHSIPTSSPQAFHNPFPNVSSPLQMMPTSYPGPAAAHPHHPQTMPLTPQATPGSTRTPPAVASPPSAATSWAQLGNPTLHTPPAAAAPYSSPSHASPAAAAPYSGPSHASPAAAAPYSTSPHAVGSRRASPPRPTHEQAPATHYHCAPAGPPVPPSTPPAAPAAPAPVNVNQPPPPPPARTLPPTPCPPSSPSAATTAAAPPQDNRAAAEKPQEAPKQPPSRCKSGLVPGQDISLLDYFFNPQYNPIATHGRNLIRY